jgi:hypothetical protein
MDGWTQEEIDEDVFRCDKPDDCDCVDADMDLLEGRAHCHICGRSWYLTKDELLAELGYQAEQQELIAEEMERS